MMMRSNLKKYSEPSNQSEALESVLVYMEGEACSYWDSTSRLVEDRTDLSNGPKTGGASSSSSSIGQGGSAWEARGRVCVWSVVNRVRFGRCEGRMVRRWGQNAPYGQETLVR